MVCVLLKVKVSTESQLCQLLVQCFSTVSQKLRRFVCFLSLLLAFPGRFSLIFKPGDFTVECQNILKNVTGILCQSQSQKIPNFTTILSQEVFIYFLFSVNSQFPRQLSVSGQVWCFECLNKSAGTLPNSRPPWLHSVGHLRAEDAGHCSLFLLPVGSRGHARDYLSCPLRSQGLDCHDEHRLAICLNGGRELKMHLIQYLLLLYSHP